MKGGLSIWLFFLPVLGVCQEQAVPATAVTGVGGFVGNRLQKNEKNYLAVFDIGKYVGLMETRSFTGWDWRQGEQPGKWLEAAILTAARTKDIALEREARRMFDRLVRSQAADGYIGITSQAVRTAERPLGGMDAYELYFLQHALLTAYEVWKDPRGLKAARRLGDYFVSYIGPGKAEFWPSPLRPPENKGRVLKGTMHSEIAGHSIHYSWEGTLLIDPMMRLYELSGDRRYYDWCKWVVSSIDKWSGWDAYSNLDKVASGEMPIEKIQPYVHAHTFQMNFLGLLRMYRVSGDTSYLRKVVGAWRDIASRQLYITGGVSVGEHYERDHVKPLTGEMMETCATMSWMQVSQELLDITGDSKYADAIERILWNNVFAEQTIDGDANHYFTPPNGYVPKGYYREPDCCMSSGPRLLAMLPGFIYGSGAGTGRGNAAGRAVYINQFIASTAVVGGTRITQRTNFPEDGKIEIRVDPVRATAFTVYVRIPEWADSAVVEVNGDAVKGIRNGTYLVLARVWHAGDRITLELPMRLRWVRHDHYERTANRKPYKTEPDADAPWALMRGPVVYAADDIWYQGDTAVFGKGWMDSVRYMINDPARLRAVQAPGPDILGPGYQVELLLANGNRTTLPVYPFANIGKWYRDAAHKPDSNKAAYSYAIWLKGSPGRAEVVLPHVFGDKMVLQRGMPVPVWGKARPGSEVTVAFHGQTRSGTADAEGRWRVELAPMRASDAGSVLTVAADGTRVEFRDVLVGDVWLCSGQSNMEYSMRRARAVDSADDPSIRIFLVRTNYSKTGNGIRREWYTAEGMPVRDFSAAGYFFGKEINKWEHVPIGLISNAVPGSRIEPWLPESGDAGGTAGSEGKFYKNLVRPLAPYALKGFLWYQGESNCFVNDTLGYGAKMEMLIDSWRRLWEDTVLPFYYVQIAPYQYSKTTGSTETEPAFWWAQEKALELPRTGMVMTTDLVDSMDQLHPTDKRDVGLRLARWALAKTYGEPVVYSGPTLKRVSGRGKRVELEFGNVGEGLVSEDRRPLSWFETAGPDGKFAPVRAVIADKDKIVLKARHKPVAVRFGWNEAAKPNLFNKEGLPAMPFRAAVNDNAE